jgi:glycine oxidase
MRVGIIGGGVIGCAIAWRLARQGAAVTVFEHRGVGTGATQASAGALVPYVEAHEPSPLQDLTVRSLNLFDQFIEELRAETRKPIDYARCGSLEVAFTEDEDERLRAVAARNEAAGVRWIDTAETLKLEPTLSPAVRGSLAVDQHGYVSAPQLTQALADAAVMAGAFFRDARVTDIGPAGESAEIATDSGAVERFDRIVVASGAWARLLDIEGAPRLPIRPIKGQLLRLRGLRPSRLVWSRDCYVVPQQTGDVLVGATVEDAGFDERATVAGLAQLVTAAMALVPSIGQGEFVEARVGLRPATADNLPLVGYAQDSTAIAYAVGHFRNGIVLAPLTARIVAELILDNVIDPALAILSPSRLGM